MTANKVWHRTFDDPIPLPGGGELRTLRDAGNYIAGLSKREHDAPAWLAAIQALMLVAEHGGTPCCPGSKWCGLLNVGKPVNISAVERLPRNTR